MQSAPLWLKKPTFPGRAIWVANVALRPESGPHDSEAVGPDQAHAAAPGLLEDPALEQGARAGPISLNPAEMMMAPLTPATAHSPITVGDGAGRGDDDGEVDRLGDGRDPGIGVDVEHLGAGAG